LIKDFKLDSGKVIMIPNSIYVDNYSRKNFDFKNGIKIVFAGRVENKQKGVFMLPGIISKLIPEFPQVYLTVIGAGPDLNKLKELTNNMKMDKYFHFEGSLPNEQVRQILKDFHFIIIPSNQEGLPFILLEAMAEGVVPIMSFLPGVADMVIEDESNGYFAEPGNINSFADSIRRAILNSQNLETMSSNAYKKVLSEFSMESTGQKFVTLLFSDSWGPKERTRKVDIESIPYRFPFLPIIAEKAINKFFMKSKSKIHI
jgi:glycosyltransferase involved in cell wall biosynthesis